MPDANYGDALKVIAGFLNFDKYRPTLVIINPITFNAFKGLKDKTGRPIWRDYFTVVNGVYYLDGVIPVVECDAIAKGKVFMGDFDEGAALYDMDGGTLEFAEDVQTKLTNTAVAILQEEVAMPVYCVLYPIIIRYVKTQDVNHADDNEDDSYCHFGHQQTDTVHVAAAEEATQHAQIERVKHKQGNRYIPKDGLQQLRFHGADLTTQKHQNPTSYKGSDCSGEAEQTHLHVGHLLRENIDLHTQSHEFHLFEFYIR